MAQVNEVKEADVVNQLKNEIAALKKEAARKDGEITLLLQQLKEAKANQQALKVEEDKNKETYQCVDKCFYENVLYKPGDLVRFPKGMNVPEWFRKVE